MGDGSLSEREQRILEEIERNLLAEDEAFVRRYQQVGPRRDAVRMLRLGIAGIAVGLGLLLLFLWHWAAGLFGFCLMLAGVVATVVAVRALAGNGQASTAFRDAWKRAEGRMRDRRGDT